MLVSFVEYMEHWKYKNHGTRVSRNPRCWQDLGPVSLLRSTASVGAQWWWKLLAGCVGCRQWKLWSNFWFWTWRFSLGNREHLWVCPRDALHIKTEEFRTYPYLYQFYEQSWLFDLTVHFSLAPNLLTKAEWLYSHWLPNISKHFRWLEASKVASKNLHKQTACSCWSLTIRTATIASPTGEPLTQLQGLQLDGQDERTLICSQGKPEKNPWYVCYCWHLLMPFWCLFDPFWMFILFDLHAVWYNMI